MAPTFHLFLPQMRMPVEAVVERAVAAEAAGFEGIAFMDHLAPPLAEEHDMWEAMAIAGWVLARTTTLQVGHLVLCDAFRHPAVLARQLTTLDHASGGRVELGIGWGSVPTEIEAYGIGSAEPRQRVGRLAESLEVLRGLWTGEPVDHRGEHLTLVGARQRPVPTRRIPITIGGVGPRTLALAAEHADWWNVPIHEVGRLDELRDRVGDCRVSVQSMLAVISSEAQRDEVTARAQRRFGGTMGRDMVVGTPDQLAEHAAGLHARGVDRIYAWFADFAPVDSLELFGEAIAATR